MQSAALGASGDTQAAAGGDYLSQERCEDKLVIVNIDSAELAPAFAVYRDEQQPTSPAK